MTIDKKTIDKVSTLAKIKLNDKKIDDLTEELSKILDWINQLNEVKTEDILPLTGVLKTKLFLREDIVVEDSNLEEVLSNSPETIEGFYVVPRVVD
tara:strand:+ start:450 stop:737 length:288 start_codon:yes stop_codon:yes gene_type:complete